MRKHSTESSWTSINPASKTAWKSQRQFKPTNKHHKISQNCLTSRWKKCRLITKHREPSSWSSRNRFARRISRTKRTAKRSSSRSSTSSRRKSTARRTRLPLSSKRARMLSLSTCIRRRLLCSTMLRTTSECLERNSSRWRPLFSATLPSATARTSKTSSRSSSRQR